MGAGSGEREGAGRFYKSLKGVGHGLNPNARLAYKRLFRLFCDFCYEFHLNNKYTLIGDSHRAFFDCGIEYNLIL